VEVVVLLLGRRLRISPVARDDVLVRVDQLSAVRHRRSVHEVFRHDDDVPVRAGDQSPDGSWDCGGTLRQPMCAMMRLGDSWRHGGARGRGDVPRYVWSSVVGLRCRRIFGCVASCCVQRNQPAPGFAADHAVRAGRFGCFLWRQHARFGARLRSTGGVERCGRCVQCGAACCHLNLGSCVGGVVATCGPRSSRRPEAARATGLRARRGALHLR
jgi:hypothetical protein